MTNNLILQKISNSIHKQDTLALAYLFGSRARGNNRENSDWDILILVKNSEVTNELVDSYRNELYDIELETGKIISTLIYPMNEWENKLKFSPLYNNVQKEGIVI